MSTTSNASNTLIIKRLIKAPRERLFAAWTTPTELVKWFGPVTCQALSARLNPSPGGNYDIHVRSQLVGEVNVRGVYREVAPSSRLVFTWKWNGNAMLDFGDSLVTVDFLAAGSATDLHITHEGLPSAELRDDHNYGWTGCLDKLEKFLGLPCREQPPVGGFCWNELMTSDVAAAAQFYTQLFDWQTVQFPITGFAYTLFKKSEREVGGLMASPVPNAPPHWLAHVHVADVDATAKKAASLGGRILTPPFDVPTVGRVAILQDPQGAVLGVFKPGQS